MDGIKMENARKLDSKTISFPEEHAKEASKLIEIIGKLDKSTELFDREEEYPFLKNLYIFTRAVLLVNPVYSKERILELQDELYIRICNVLGEDSIKINKEDFKEEGENSKINKEKIYSSKYK
jgi:hypothetical protein